ncbi:hypothetical protein OIU74_021095 [Salix koriyanagi]|uniref:Uncharacterized protein n=1 Tax=Salix koriyanagi TaxID=2511006 RepID=A0A9Q0SMA0_9ROSI|nr:hypothetical protein OIU74_021095 [Salix koriyanagi]
MSSEKVTLAGKAKKYAAGVLKPVTLGHIEYKLTVDSMRWDSLKISPSREFNNHNLENLYEANRKDLDMWKPVEVSIYDTDTHETYKVSLAKEAFWFEPFPDAAHRKLKKSAASNKTLEHYMNEVEQMSKDFSYSPQPFRHIIKKSSLIYDQEIGLCCSGNETAVDRIDFSLLYTPRLHLHGLSP